VRPTERAGKPSKKLNGNASDQTQNYADAMRQEGEPKLKRLIILGGDVAKPALSHRNRSRASRVAHNPAAYECEQKKCH